MQLPKWKLQVQLVNPTHQRQIRFAGCLRPVVRRRARQRQNLALPGHRQIVGSVGHDNYKRKGEAGNRRIVYGRRWRIDTYIPTSEVIQTAFLAIKKACEHEVRELLTIQDRDSGRTGTPFSTHLDLSLMARFPELVMREASSAKEPLPETWLQGIRFDGREIKVDDVTIRRNGNLIVDLVFAEPSSPRVRSGFEQLPMTIVLREFSEASLVHEVMNALITRIWTNGRTLFPRFSSSISLRLHLAG
jgi:hypothetical protein